MYALPSLSGSSFDILPGPFILLLLIPLLPLTLFSLGARPPGIDSFPFLTDELWRTTALLGMAVTIGLCVGVYPDSLQSMVTWVRDGRMTAVGISKPDWLSWGPGRGASKAALARRIARSRKPSFERIAVNHIAALRYYHPRLYNASRPKLSSVVGLGLAVTLVIIVVLGKVLREVYESESRPAPRQSSGAGKKEEEKGPSEWVQREYRKRKEEKPDETKTRFKAEESALAEKYKRRKKDAEAADKADKPDKGKGEKKTKTKVEEHEKSMMKKSEERRKDVKELKKMLEARKIEPIGLDKDPGWMMKDKSKDKDKEKDEDKDEEKEKGKKEEAEAKKEKDQGVKTKTTVGDWLRTALLGKTMAESMKRDSKKRQEAQGTGGAAAAAVPPAFTPAAVPQRGPGWEVDDNHTAAQIALAKSAGNAEALAKGMGK